MKKLFFPIVFLMVVAGTMTSCTLVPPTEEDRMPMLKEWATRENTQAPPSNKVMIPNPIIFDKSAFPPRPSIELRDRQIIITK